MTDKPRLGFPIAPVAPDVGLWMTGPLTALRLWAELTRMASSTAPASMLVAVAPFFWAPPLWVGALMAAQAADPSGGAEGSTVTAAEAAALPGRTKDAPPRNR